jgi:hypothetical protein
MIKISPLNYLLQVKYFHRVNHRYVVKTGKKRKTLSFVLNTIIFFFFFSQMKLRDSNTASSIWSNTQRHLALRTISTNKVSYAFDEDIKITFRIDDARRGDWVVILDAKTKINSQAKGLFWMWLGCKRQGSLKDCPSRVRF